MKAKRNNTTSQYSIIKILKDQGQDTSRGAGYINVGNVNKDGKSEVS